MIISDIRYASAYFNLIIIYTGPGSLTRSLLRLGAKKVIAVEKDGRFISFII